MRVRVELTFEIGDHYRANRELASMRLAAMDVSGEIDDIACYFVDTTPGVKLLRVSGPGWERLPEEPAERPAKNPESDKEEA